MLEKEREILSNTIKNNGHIPITMERDFLGSNSERSLNIDKKEIEESDAVICILSFLYGELIGNKIGNIESCPLKNSKCKNCCCSEESPICTISFTEFEYCYAKKLRKPTFVIYNSEYNNDSAFETAISTNSYNFRRDYYNRYENKKEAFFNTVTQYHCYPYNIAVENSFKEECDQVLSAAIKKICEIDPEFKYSPNNFIDKGDHIELKVPINKIHMIEKICSPDRMDWYEAKSYARNLKKGDYRDWRLPTKEELKEIYKVKNICGIVQNNFRCWSSSAPSDTASYAWFVDLSNGVVNSFGKSLDNNVICVR